MSSCNKLEKTYIDLTRHTLNGGKGSLIKGGACNLDFCPNAALS